MIDLLKHEALAHVDKLQMISISCLKNLKKEIEVFKENEDLNNFQRWIVNKRYYLN